VQQSARPTSLAHFSAPRMPTPSSNRNLQNDFNSPESISPWSYNNLMNKPAPKDVLRVNRIGYRADLGFMAGDELQYNSPSNDQFQIGPNTVIKQMRPEIQQALKDRLVFM